MKTKTILIGLGVAVVGLAILGAAKVKNLADIFDKMSIKPVGIRKISFLNLSSTKFNLDVRLVNPTNQAFSVNGVVATLTRLVIYYKGKYLAEADLNISEIEVPANGSVVISDIPVTADNLAALEVLFDFGNLNMKNLEITATVSALGIEYQI
ncbi:hypothetical protein MH928_17220 [Flavobacterium sp. WW92]|uniref:hypothetical protein n=1 Tax=unclassified Flavobacterium TaxID=196869 RepID=UPI0022245CB9|nr:MULTISPECIES: hypothetical protein [unclassified Flavobacterium]WDO13049.1 hypothetical protein MH928_17220 [Flavobacterium sp. WW92]